MMKRVISFTIAVCAVALIGGRAFADNASDIEQFYGTAEAAVVWDSPAIVTDIACQPGTFGGHNFTAYTLFAADTSGSMDIFASVSTLNVLSTNTYSAPAVGDALTMSASYSPFHQIPEIGFSTSTASNQYIFKVGTGSIATPVFTVNTLSAVGSGLSTHINIAGYYLEIQNAALSGSTGNYQSTFPAYTTSIAAESYTITDSTGSMELFDWTTSYSTAAAFGGSPVPTAAYLASVGSNLNAYGFVSYNGTLGPLEFTMTSEQFVAVPEPSTVMLAGTALLGLLALRRRRWPV